MSRPPVGRLLTLLAVMIFGLSAVMVRLAVLQVREGTAYEEQGYVQRVHTFDLPAERGSILDRSRQPLALSVAGRDVYADPELVVDPHATAEAIAPVLGLEVRDVRPSLVGDRSFAYVARQVDLATAARLEALHLAGIGFLPSPKRSYPGGSLAAQVVGFVGTDGTGITGLERQYQATLAGSPGTLTQETSPGGQPIAQGVNELEAPVPGDDLVTTLDRQFQYQVQVALKQAVEDNHAIGGTVIVMNPHTGDVYAMANYPSFDPNAFADAVAHDPGAIANRALVDAFEPGSVNKVITAAAAIEEGAVSPEDRIVVPYSMTIGPYEITDSHPHPTERMTLGDIIAESSNIGAAKVAGLVGAPTMAAYLDRFGFGHNTGTGFPGETSGIVPPLRDWSDTSLATISYGQGISVSPMQMASVYATVANDGVWVQPRLVNGIVDAGGAFRPADAASTQRVVSKATADTLTQMLASVVQDGTGTGAQIPGYPVAGKTGTALKVDPETGEYEHKYVASFIGFLPASDPQVVIAAVIDEPTTVYGGIAAAPLFQQVARYAIQRLGISPGEPVKLPPSALGLR
jgi:cell division protein FtsI (penicillin-binding protein 3)